MFKKWFKAENVLRLNIFDFDDTLVFTPQEEDGKATVRAYNKKNPSNPIRFDRYYWYSKQSLMPPVLPEPAPMRLLNQEIAGLFAASKRDKQAMTVVITGRPEELKKEVLRVLSDYKLEPDEIYLTKDREMVVDSKIKHMDALIRKMPNLEEIAVYDDRGPKNAKLTGNPADNHIKHFREFLNAYNDERKAAGQPPIKIKVTEVLRN